VILGNEILSLTEEITQAPADYLMLNTDRGADNYMIKYCEADHEKTLVDVAPTRSLRLEMPLMSELKRTDSTPSNIQRTDAGSSRNVNASPALSEDNLGADYTRKPHLHIAAIDNSLSFPHEHPQGWRSYTYGWLYLPVSIIGRPFGERTREHFLSFLTSRAWWEETTFQLRKLFAVDPDFHPKMFAVSATYVTISTVRPYVVKKRQMAVIKGQIGVNELSLILDSLFHKGQAWNIIQSLKHSVSDGIILDNIRLICITG
jgi:phosphatidylinositol 4-kinase type 2